MIALFTDIDNTLIYSKRREVNVPKTCVEIYNNVPLSYMTNTSIQSLKDLISDDRLDIIPVTTRADYQYDRIDLPKFEYVLLCNGGILLKNGVRDEDWYNESWNYAENCLDDLEKAKEFLHEDKNRSFDVRFVEDLFIFTKSENPDDTVSMLSSFLNTDKVTVCTQGNKIYVFPKELSKGNALRRFKEYKSYKGVVSCGDAPLDFTMANESNIFITPNNEIYESRYNSIIIKSDDNVFSDLVLRYMKEMLNHEQS
jgi:hydroxymethylpyrimidine pyrophosphatase-like HAD family hydrolase